MIIGGGEGVGADDAEVGGGVLAEEFGGGLGEEVGAFEEFEATDVEDGGVGGGE